MPHDRRTIAHEWFDRVWNQGRAEAIDELFALNPVEFTGISILRVRDGQIVEAWNNFDFATIGSSAVFAMARA